MRPQCDTFMHRAHRRLHCPIHSSLLFYISISLLSDNPFYSSHTLDEERARVSRNEQKNEPGEKEKARVGRSS